MPDQIFSIYLPLEKTELQPDGTMLVWGRATQETPDSDGEICDFETSAPLFQRRSQMMKDASEGKNLFPLRSMHQPIAAGKIVEMNYLSEDKAIDVCAKVIDENEVKKVKEGVYTGFSVAGRYARRWRDPTSQYMRYTADPREISLVDVPAVPTARFTMFKLEGDDDIDPLISSSVAPEWVADFIKAVSKLEELNLLEKAEKQQQENKLKALGERIGIPRRDGSPLSAPKEYPSDANEYGDPANWAYPVDSSRSTVAVGRFNGGIGAEQYSPRSRHVLGRRIARLASRSGTKYKYDPASKKIINDKVGKTMSDSEHDQLLQLKAAIDNAVESVEGNPTLAKDALGTIVNQVRGLANTSTPVGANPSGPTLNTGVPIKAAEDKKEDEDAEDKKDNKAPEAEIKEKLPPAVEKTAAAVDVKESPEYKALMAKLEEQVGINAKISATLEKSNVVLEKFAKITDSPLGDLNSLVKEKKNDTDPIVAALMEGGPYAMAKALKLAGGDDEFTGAMAFSKVNDAIRRETYRTLEEGGVVTSARYAGRIYSPAS